MTNKELLEKCFRSASNSRKLSNSSIEKYTSSIRRFFSVIGEKDFQDISIEDFEEYNFRAGKIGAKDARIANVISAVKWALAKMQSMRLIEATINLKDIEKPKIIRKEVVYLDEKEIFEFIDCIRSEVGNKPSIKNVRFLTLIMFLLQTGARIGEVLSISHADINLQRGEVGIIGKGRKERTLFLQDETMDLIRKYLAMRIDEHEALFVSLSGKSRWQQTDVGRSFRRFKNLSGISKKFTLHTLRHTFATQYLSKHVPLNTVQFLLGHSTPMTTLKFYVGAVEKDNAKKVIMDEHFNFIPKTAVKSEK